LTNLHHVRSAFLD